MMDTSQNQNGFMDLEPHFSGIYCSPKSLAPVKNDCIKEDNEQVFHLQNNNVGDDRAHVSHMRTNVWSLDDPPPKSKVYDFPQ